MILLLDRMSLGMTVPVRKTESVDGIAPATLGVFVSYRREDSAFLAGWLYERLSKELGRDHIFKDVDSIRPGEDFVEVIQHAIRSCHTMLVLIGRNWFTATDATGVRRLEQETDLVRKEIELAIANDVALIPVLVEGTLMPSELELPASIASLARKNAVAVDPVSLDAAVARLLPAIESRRVERVQALSLKRAQMEVSECATGSEGDDTERSDQTQVAKRQGLEQSKHQIEEQGEDHGKLKGSATESGLEQPRGDRLEASDLQEVVPTDQIDSHSGPRRLKAILITTVFLIVISTIIVAATRGEDLHATNATFDPLEPLGTYSTSYTSSRLSSAFPEVSPASSCRDGLRASGDVAVARCTVDGWTVSFHEREAATPMRGAADWMIPPVQLAPAPRCTGVAFGYVAGSAAAPYSVVVQDYGGHFWLSASKYTPVPSTSPTQFAARLNDSVACT